MQNYRICVSNLPSNTNEEKLKSIFCEYDFIKITLVKSYKGECKGFAYVEFASESELNKVLEMKGYKLDGKKLKIEKEKEELCELKKHVCMKKNKEEREGIKEIKIEENDIEKLSIEEMESKKEKEEFKNKKEYIHQRLEELSKSMNEKIFSKCLDTGTEIPVALSTNNPQLVCELKHLFNTMDEKEFKEQIARNDELKKIYENCCSTEQVCTEDKLCKIKHLKFNDNPIKDEQLKTLCSVLVKSFEGSDIDFNICNRLASNMKCINIVPQQAIVFELTFDNEILGDHTFKEFTTDKRKQKVIELNLQKKLSEILQIPFGEIVFVKIRQGSVKFDGIIPSKVLSRHTELEIDIQEYIYKTLKEKMIEGLGKIYPLKHVEVALQTIKTKLNLNPADFDTRGDYYFRTNKGEKLMRGGMSYYQPSNKWKRYGLRVLGLYESDDWIKMDGNPNEWIVAFHGTRNSGERGLESITKTRFIGRGSSNAYGGHTSTNRKEKIPKLGIYFAQNIEDCYKMPIELDGEKYMVAFQCRIHPDHVWVTGNRTFVVVDNPNFVRPYGICLKPIKKKFFK